MPLSQARLKEVLHYAPETGVFTRILSRGNAAAGSVAGSPNNYGYPQVMIDGHLISCHRLAWLYMTGSLPTHQIDHIDGDRKNNRWTNLRDVTTSVNQQNRRTPRSDNSCGLIGVTREKNNRFTASIRFEGKQRRLGTFATPEEAHSVYVEAKRRVHEGCTL